MSSVGEANIQEAAVILGYSVPTIKRYIQLGMPVKSKGGRGKDYVLSLPDCVAWVADLKVKNAIGDVDQATEQELRRRKLAAETKLAELEALKKTGEVIYIDDAVRIRTHEALAVKASLLAIPPRIDHVLAGSNDRKFCRTTLNDEILGALEELATRSIDVESVFPSKDGGDESNGLGSSAKSKAERVGRAKRKNTGRKRKAGKA